MGIFSFMDELTGLSPEATLEALLLGLEAAESEPEPPELEPLEPSAFGGLGFLLERSAPFCKIVPSPNASRGSGHGSATVSGSR